ncbi:MAG: helix-turn-helix domain-containing protein [Acidobacteriota bacterium]|jgi:excisionase family DNA binding protein|nr:helix-turn-helix domain-containing protein [Acidobacteriota bacterium]
MSFEKLLKATDVSEILDLKPARIYELTRQRKIPFVQIGERQYRYDPSAIEQFIANGGNRKNEVQDEK